MLLILESFKLLSGSLLSKSTEQSFPKTNYKILDRNVAKRNCLLHLPIALLVGVCSILSKASNFLKGSQQFLFVTVVTKGDLNTILYKCVSLC